MPKVHYIKNYKRYEKELLEVFLGIKNASMLRDFLTDLLTPQELDEIVTRWQLVKLLHSGVPQRTIAKKLNVSIAKITRGSRMLLNKSGGFNKVLRKNKK